LGVLAGGDTVVLNYDVESGKGLEKKADNYRHVVSHALYFPVPAEEGNVFR
jgi:hypothetical protein